MKTNIERDLKGYYKEISKALPKDGRKTLLPDIKAGVNSYLAENPDAAIDDVIAYVGTPECIAGEYYANQDGTKITREIKASRLILTIVISIVMFVLVIYIGFMLYTIVKDVLGFPTYRGDVVEIGRPFDVTETDLD